MNRYGAYRSGVRAWCASGWFALRSQFVPFVHTCLPCLACDQQTRRRARQFPIAVGRDSVGARQRVRGTFMSGRDV
eukprot:9790490-Alexandrium_andersonii.AAC.1